MIIIGRRVQKAYDETRLFRKKSIAFVCAYESQMVYYLSIMIMNTRYINNNLYCLYHRTVIRKGNEC